MLNQNDHSFGISIVVPCYNEVNSVKSTVEQIHQVMKDVDYAYELITVDDGSTDGTLQVLESLENVFLYKHEKNVGYGASLKTGITHAKYNAIVITDADGTYPIDKIPALVAEYREKRVDMLVAARRGANVNIPLIRRPAKWVLRKLASVLSGHNIPDLNSGLRVMNRDIVSKFFSIISDQFSFTTTVTLALLSNGYNVTYTPIDYFHREGSSKIKPISDTLSFLQQIIRTITYFQPLKVFLPLGLLFILISFVFLLFRLIAGQGFLVVTIVLFTTGIQILSLGMIAEMINKRLK